MAVTQNSVLNLIDFATLDKWNVSYYINHWSKLRYRKT